MLVKGAAWVDAANVQPVPAVPGVEMGALTTGKRLYADGQNYADGSRRPTWIYADSLLLAVGLPLPSGYPYLHRRQPLAHISRRYSLTNADSCHRHKSVVGIHVGPATPPVTSG